MITNHDRAAQGGTSRDLGLGAVLKARDRLIPEGRWDALRSDLVALCERASVAEDGFRAPSEYLLTLGRKRA